MATVEWTDEQLADAMSKGQQAAPDGISVSPLPAPSLAAVMTRAVELAAERGGTMTGGRIDDVLKTLPLDDDDRELRQHLAAQGARIAALEDELAATESAQMALLADVGKVLDQRDGEATLDACERVMRTLDEALADNVALVDHARTERQMLALLYHRIKALGVHTDAMADAVTTVERWMDAVPDTYESPHPGAALLEQHREELAAAARRHETTRATMHVREEQHRKEVAALKADLAKLEEMACGTCSPEEWATQEARKVAEVLREAASAMARERVERYEEVCALKQRIAKARADGRNEGLEMAAKRFDAEADKAQELASRGSSERAREAWGERALSLRNHAGEIRVLKEVEK